MNFAACERWSASAKRDAARPVARHARVGPRLPDQGPNGLSPPASLSPPARCGLGLLQARHALAERHLLAYRENDLAQSDASAQDRFGGRGPGLTIASMPASARAKSCRPLLQRSLVVPRLHPMKFGSELQRPAVIHLRAITAGQWLQGAPRRAFGRQASLTRRANGEGARRRLPRRVLILQSSSNSMRRRPAQVPDHLSLSGSCQQFGRSGRRRRERATERT